MTDTTLATRQTSALAEIPMMQQSELLAPGRRVELAKFTPQQKTRITQISNTVALVDSNSITGFGAEPQQRLNKFVDQLMEGLRTSDVGVAGELTVELATGVKAMNLQKMKKEADGGDWVANTFGKLPVIGKYASALRYFQLTRKEVISHLNAIEEKAQREMGALRATNTKLDRLVEATLDNIHELELYLAAGQVALARAHEEFNAMREDLRATNDPVKVAQLRDAYEQINAFEARLVRMDLAFTRSLKAVPEIRITQEAARIEICNVMDTILFDLPELKRVILQVGALEGITRARKTDEARRELVRQIGGLGADTLQSAYTKSKESQGNVAADVAALSDAATKLLETMQLGARIDAENRQKREAATQQLGDIRAKLLSGVQEHAERVLSGTP